MNYQKILPLFSYIFHPVFIPLFGTISYFLLSNTEYKNAGFIVLLIQVVILTVLLPLSIYFLMKATGKIETFTEATINERKIPLLIQAILLLFLINFSGFVSQITPIYCFFWGGVLASVLAFILVLLKYKASLHMIGMSSFLTFIIGLSIYFNISIIPIIAILIVLTGNVASSRLYMKSHTLTELLVGTLIGSLSQLVMCFFYL